MPPDICTDKLHYDVPLVRRRWGFWEGGYGVQWMSGVCTPAVKRRSIGAAMGPLLYSRSYRKFSLMYSRRPRWQQESNVFYGPCACLEFKFLFHFLTNF
jgi:hypothetical protein